jgi:DNA topoisomerase IB
MLDISKRRDLDHEINYTGAWSLRGRKVDAYEIKIFALRAGEIKAEVLRI